MEWKSSVPKLRCPECGEERREGLSPRREGERIFVTCKSCGHDRRCTGCGWSSEGPPETSAVH